MTRRVCVVLVDRANYGRLRPVMASIQAHPDLSLQVVAAGTLVLDRFQRPVDVVRADGFPIDEEVFLEVEGSTPTTMAKSVGFGTVEFAGAFQRLQPDLVLLIGDRYEALAATVAAAYMNLCIVHIQGGEVSGSIDESARHAISHFAHFHVPATERARTFLLRMGARAETILTVGCPSSDLARGVSPDLEADVLNAGGSGATIRPDAPYLLALYHPTTTEHGNEAAQMEELLAALAEVRMPTVLLWANIDAGSNDINRAIRIYRDRHGHDVPWLRTLINLPPDRYLQVLAGAACAVGNSSSFVRDSTHFGTPVVLVGNRQHGREHGDNLVRVPVAREAIEDAIRERLATGRHPPSTLYGDGQVSDRVADAVAALTPYVQKSLSFVDEVAEARP